ncbi:glutamine--fructose-6-phosphate transaminase (isomerizing) [Peptoniphilus sp. KCTC 25270]|uniref:glutamine--fructose-6-phosphate transaminase (isomerizing) n=1 Tax=Peptoniphilus sp. KCTC 25270 TaxID=2897414 RepID=UPI001E37DD18|nr:glutamine--fructose-6-phosphate transaminase (isomerizing) [Peptoniphilus sp. KCTC 25270]MCD1146948.1 glutamine--fructose-6-phosphate transaminase (isomerizing) [Peptoniphilus sp. KCTC 25270]
MCGIVAYNGKSNAQERIIHGLEKLEYRGYDSAGIAVVDNGALKYVKSAGRLQNLKDKLEQNPVDGNCGIGHTRWATHGVPNEINSHPHLNTKEDIALVHNGIIENFSTLKEELIADGYTFKTETDTEVIANLLDKHYDGNLSSTVEKVISLLRGTFALAIISSRDPGTLVAARRENPLILGIAEDGVFAASDVPALLNYTRDVIYIENDEVATIQNDGSYSIRKFGEEVEKEIHHIEWSMESASKDGFDHFMIKEIYEQPKVLKDCLLRKVKNDFVDLGETSFTKEEILGFDKIYMSACGTAFHASEIGKRAIEDAIGKEVTAEIASEFKYNMPFLTENSLLIIVSQSGETLDTLTVLREAKDRGAKVLAITNVVGSSIDRESDKVIYCDAGPEISVASTKAYSTQLLSLYLLALDFGYKLGTYDKEFVTDIVKEFESLPEKVEKMFDSRDSIREIAKTIANKKSMFFLGRGLDYLSAKEGALKLKEISYINAVAMPSGELKHGSIALIEEGVPVVTLLSQMELFEKSISNIKEIKARGAYTIAIASEENSALRSVADEVILIPKTHDMYMPLLAVLPQQILAYETSVILGNDVDKPRNLAKSVTVE